MLPSFTINDDLSIREKKILERGVLSDTIQIPPSLKALSAEHRCQFCSPSPALVTFSISERKKILERYVLCETIKIVSS
jgi:hypothetical protein